MSEFDDPNLFRFIETNDAGNWEVVCNKRFASSFMKHLQNCEVPVGLSPDQEPSTDYVYITGSAMMNVKPFVKQWMIDNHVGEPRSL